MDRFVEPARQSARRAISGVPSRKLKWFVFLDLSGNCYFPGWDHFLVQFIDDLADSPGR